MKKIIRYIILISVVLISVLCSVQNRKIEFFRFEKKYGHVDINNKLLLKYNLPFCLKLEPNKKSYHFNLHIDTALVLQFRDRDSLIDIFHINNSQEYIGAIEKLYSKSSGTYYRVTICEDIIEIDYFLLIKENPFECYISQNYHLLPEMYKFIDSSMNFKEGFINIYYPKSKTIEKVSFVPLKIE